MTAMASPLAGAPSTSMRWEAIEWQKAIRHVRQLQMRIVKAYQQGKKSKVKALQWILAHSFYAKLLAVKRVVQNTGAKTPGIDNVVWNTPLQKMKAALSLERKSYQTKPLKRIYISKKQKGKVRPLSIPSMKCRAMQALYLLTLEPIVEMMADKNAYGFRPLRSTADAIERCFKALYRKGSAQYILEGDIQSCFDSISSSWLLENAPMDKKILKKWLAAGYIDKGKLYPTITGVPQGGIASTALLNVTLSGLEAAIKAVVKEKDKVHVCIYADDFIVTGMDKEVLENKVQPVIESFLSVRGLSLSKEKTKITHINEGFDFLGMNIRKYKDKLVIKPAKSSVKRFLANLRETIKCNKTAKTVNLIHLLNPKIRGWTNYYRHVCSKDTFGHVDKLIFQAIWCWAVRRHPNKSKTWVKNRYYYTNEFRDWTFFAKTKDKEGKLVPLNLILAKKTPIQRHIKIRCEATPYDKTCHDYLDRLISFRQKGKNAVKRSKWWLCWWRLFEPNTRTGKPGRIIAAAL